MAALAICVVSGSAQAQTVVNQVKLGVSGASQGHDGEFFIEKVKVRDVDIINLALATPTGTKPPANFVLALTTNCGDGDSQLVVWDTNADMELAQVSQTFSITDDAVNADKNGQLATSRFVESVDFSDSGDNTWGIEDGEVHLAGSVKWADVDGTHCPVSMKAALVGTISVWAFGQEIDVLATKAKMGAKGPISVQ
ncbi:MAG: hypothetical protein ABFS46_15995 [Myxococcota bacterium]